MTQARRFKRVFRVFPPWKDAHEEDWLHGMALQGWHLVSYNGFVFRFEKGEPADVVYRLDFHSTGKVDVRDYISAFRDAGWDHVGSPGLLLYCACSLYFPCRTT